MPKRMLRRRYVDPGIATDDDLAFLGIKVKYLFMLLPCVADREGRLEDRPLFIKAELFPHEDPKAFDVDELLEALARPREYSQGGFIIRYAAGGRKYIQIRNFAQYQNPHPKEPASKIPAPAPENDPKVDPGSIQDRSKVDPGSIPSAADRAGSSGSSGSSQLKTAPPAPESRELEPPPVKPRELKLEPEPEPAALARKGNPYRFVAFWQDANEERDFGLRFEPETGPAEFVDTEIERLELEAPRKEIEGTVRATIEVFVGTYSKRTGRVIQGRKKKTRGSQLHPEQLTEELVSWLRKDLARLAARPRAPTRGGLRSVDDAITKSVERGRQIDKAGGKGKGNKWQPRKQSLRPSRD